MILSMTGYGRGEASAKGISVQVEIRSVNSRFLEISTRLPRSLSLRENEIKEILRQRISRAKLNVLVAVERANSGAIALKVNRSAARSYVRLLNELRRTVKLREAVRLEHLLQFSDILEGTDMEGTDEQEWIVAREALTKAVEDLEAMRRNEGMELKADFHKRIASLQERLDRIELFSREQVPQERARLQERIRQLMDGGMADEGRLEMEIALLADRLDVTEECVRFRSHNKFFLEALESPDVAGRRLNFLVQEMNREVNTIGSKSSSTDIAHLVVRMKEELEKIREQLQNIE